MLVIRFLRTGKRNQPSFKLVVAEKTRSSTSGRFIEEVGFYNPQTKEKVLRGDRVKYWLSVGAKPSPTVFNLLVSEKILEGKKIPVHKKAKVKETAPAPAGASASQGEKPAEPPAEKPKEELKEEKLEEDKSSSRPSSSEGDSEKEELSKTE